MKYIDYVLFSLNFYPEVCALIKDYLFDVRKKKLHRVLTSAPLHVHNEFIWTINTNEEKVYELYELYEIKNHTVQTVFEKDTAVTNFLKFINLHICDEVLNYQIPSFFVLHDKRFKQTQSWNCDGMIGSICVLPKYCIFLLFNENDKAATLHAWNRKHGIETTLMIDNHEQILTFSTLTCLNQSQIYVLMKNRHLFQYQISKNELCFVKTYELNFMTGNVCDIWNVNETMYIVTKIYDHTFCKSFLHALNDNYELLMETTCSIVLCKENKSYIGLFHTEKNQWKCVYNLQTHRRFDVPGQSTYFFIRCFQMLPNEEVFLPCYTDIGNRLRTMHVNLYEQTFAFLKQDEKYKITKDGTIFLSNTSGLFIAQDVELGEENHEQIYL